MGRKASIGFFLLSWVLSWITPGFARPALPSTANTPWSTLPGPRISGGVISQLVVDPHDAGHLIALQQQADYQQTFVESEDGGEHWQALSSLKDQWIENMAIDPARPEVLYASGALGVFRSENGGQDWTKIAENGPWIFAPQADSVYVLETAPATADCPYGPSFFLSSLDRGDTWAKKVSLGCAFFDKLAVAHSDPQVIYLSEVDPHSPSMAQSLARSVDGGASWTLTPLTGPLFQMGLFPMAVDPSNPQKLYSSSGTGLIVSSDAGQTWASTLQISGDGIFLFGFSGNEIYAGLDSLLAGAPAALYRSRDGGGSWEELPAHFPANLKSLIVIPGQPARLFAGLDGFGVDRSVDGGQSWLLKNMGLVSTTRPERLRISPGAPDALFAITDWPRWGLFKSADGGANWGQPLLETPLEDVAVSPLNHDLVWAIGPDGWLESLDGGNHWKTVSSQSGYSLAVSPAAPERPCAPVTGQDQGYLLCRNLDAEGKETWSSYPVSGSQTVGRVAISPTQGSLIFVGGTLDGGVGAIFSSEDSGKTWQDRFQAPLEYGLLDLAVSGGDPARVIAVFGRAVYHDLYVYQSLDGGKTWQDLTPQMAAAAGGDLWDGHLYRAFVFTTETGAAYYASGETVLAQAAPGQAWQVLGISNDLIYSAALEDGSPGFLWLGGEKSYWKVSLPDWSITWMPISAR
jgi:photosystem II stability/assembly factor-like uncharacterized protein